MTVVSKHNPPTIGYTIAMSNTEGYWLCSATSSEVGTWKLDLPEQIYGVGMAVINIVSDDPDFAEASLRLIAEAIDARLFPKGDPKVREDLNRIVKVVRAVCSDKQLDVLYEALGQEILDEAKLKEAGNTPKPVEELSDPD